MDTGEPGKDRESRKQFYQALRHGSVGIEMGLSVAIGWLFGSWLDGRFGTDPWLTLTFVLIGVAAAFRALFRLARKAAKEANDDSGGDSGDDGAKS